MTSLICPKCRAEMQEGFIPDIAKGAAVSRWFAGTPEPSFWTGIKVRHRESLPIMTFRCSACGYLESYAR